MDEASVRASDRLDRWKTLFLMTWLAGFAVKGADAVLSLSDDFVRTAQYILAVPMLLSVVVIASTWLRRWGNGE